MKAGFVVLGWDELIINLYKGGGGGNGGGYKNWGKEGEKRVLQLFIRKGEGGWNSSSLAEGWLYGIIVFDWVIQKYTLSGTGAGAGTIHLPPEESPVCDAALPSHPLLVQ